MNVLSVIHYPHFGGPHNRNAQIAPYLASLGITLTVVIPDEPGNALDLMRATGVNTVPIPLSRLRASRNTKHHLRTVRTFRQDVGHLRWLIRKHDAQVVLVNGLVNPQAAIAARLEGVPVVWQLLDTFAPPIARCALMPMVLYLSDSIMSSGVAVAEAHPGISLHGNPVISFFPIVDPDRFRPDPLRRAAARTELGLDQSDVVIGNVSNINPMKGHRTFLRAAALLKKAHPEARFVILGGTSASHRGYAAGLLEEAGNLGLVLGQDIMIVDPDTRVDHLEPAFDIFWLTSEPRSEGLSTVVGEAMALEIPVVAAEVGSVGESVADRVTGMLVPPRDASAFAAVTSELLADETRRVAMGQDGRKRAMALYSAQRAAELHRDAFDLAIASQTKRTRQG